MKKLLFLAAFCMVGILAFSQEISPEESEDNMKRELGGLFGDEHNEYSKPLKKYVSGTTWEEYNYLTKGYKIQVESGLDMKRGYSFKEMPMEWGVNYTGFERRAKFMQLFRDNEKTPCATLMIFRRTDTSYKAYICIPHYVSDKEIWNKAYIDFMSANGDWTRASQGYAFGMIKMISYLSSMQE